PSPGATTGSDAKTSLPVQPPASVAAKPAQEELATPAAPAIEPEPAPEVAPVAVAEAVVAELAAAPAPAQTAPEATKGAPVVSPAPTAAALPTPATVAGPNALRCTTHGLLYDSSIDTGCVLCRRQAATNGPTPPMLGEVVKPSSPNWLLPALAVAMILGGGAAWQWWQRTHGHVRLDGPLAVEYSDAFADCRMECAEVSESCAARCAPGEAAGDPSCMHGCLLGLSECETVCARQNASDLDPAQYSYATGAMPPWFDVLNATLDVRETLALCTNEALMARVEVDAAGTAVDVSVATQRSGPAAEACAATRLRGLSYPGTGSPYTFDALFDPRLDRGKLLIKRAEADLEVKKRNAGKEAVRQATIDLWDLKQKIAVRSSSPVPPPRQEAAPAPIAETDVPVVPAPAPVPGSPPARPVFSDQPSRPRDDTPPNKKDPGSLISPGSKYRSSSYRYNEYNYNTQRNYYGGNGNY
ncbi:MAG TPA: hypothetical protein VHM19_11630, partial [Polyangiales bacterium]|nr:hypothetical protein [Polyangiales bacterium]